MIHPTIKLHALLGEPVTMPLAEQTRPACLKIAAAMYYGALASGVNPVRLELDDGAGNVWTWSVRGGMRGLLGQWIGRAGL